jgi:hypothetical protein
MHHVPWPPMIGQQLRRLVPALEIREAGRA